MKGTQNKKPVQCVSEFIPTQRYNKKTKDVLFKYSGFTQQNGKEIKTETLGQYMSSIHYVAEVI